MNLLWKNPSLLIRRNKDILKANGESMVDRLGECPLSIRIQISLRLSPEEIIKLFHSENAGGKPVVYFEKEADFTMYIFGDKSTGEEHVALFKGLDGGENVPIRVHSSCLTSETFHASNCDCQEQLQMALSIVDKKGYGGVIWLHQEGRGNGLVAKAKQLKIMLEEGLDTVDAFEKAGYPKDQRDYTVAADILKDLSIKSIQLITNNPNKVSQLEALGVIVESVIPCEIEPINETVRKDLRAKRDKLGHKLRNSSL